MYPIRASFRLRADRNERKPNDQYHRTAPYAIIHGMKLRMDQSGRIVFPKPLRKRLGLAAALELEAVERPDGVLLRPVLQEPVMVRRNNLWIHLGTAEPGAQWDRVVDSVRDERIQHVLKSS